MQLCTQWVGELPRVTPTPEPEDGTIHFTQAANIKWVCLGPHKASVNTRESGAHLYDFVSSFPS